MPRYHDDTHPDLARTMAEANRIARERSTQADRDALQYAQPGHRVTIPIGGIPETFVRLEDPNPPYTSGLWANVCTGAIIQHWTRLADQPEQA